VDAGVPFFFKQWGGFQKSRNGRTLDGRTWDGVPDVVRRLRRPAA
jgi:protein gp37